MVILLNLKSLFVFLIIPQASFLEVGLVWATAGFCKVVTCWWDVGGFLLEARVHREAAVLLGAGGRTACPFVRACHWPSIIWEVGEED